ncbi:hypothetical protein HYN24_06320 [Dechloromonas sp. HYN0024]|nr:hypothetical protein HYN24_06320 [Dechloromonas sp. HYN0024]
MVATAASATAQLPDLATQMRTEIRDIGIPPRPTILQDIDNEMAKDEPDFIRLAKIIGSDVC